jgi:phospholipid transport system transporter-binding protein
VQLTPAEFRQQDQQHYMISGSVVFSTVPDLLRSAMTYLSAKGSGSEQQVVIDMSQVTDCNSAALALMLEINKQTKDNDTVLNFQQLPENLLTIAKAYGVEEQIREISE